jgi:hypothetical protein
MFITSHHTMDKLDSTMRAMLAAKAELLGAIRLPNDAFKKNAVLTLTAWPVCWIGPLMNSCRT